MSVYRAKMTTLREDASEEPRQRVRGSASPPTAQVLRTLEARQKEAEAERVELEVQKLAGEVARQSLEDQLLRVQIDERRVEIARAQSETRSLDAARFRKDVLLLVFLLMTVFWLALALVNPTFLKTVGGGLPWPPF
jgi:hypothetical protein